MIPSAHLFRETLAHSLSMISPYLYHSRHVFHLHQYGFVQLQRLSRPRSENDESPPRRLLFRGRPSRGVSPGLDVFLRLCQASPLDFYGGLTVFKLFVLHVNHLHVSFIPTSNAPIFLNQIISFD